MGTNARVPGYVLRALADELRAEAARRRVTIRELARLSDVPYPTTRKSVAGERMIDVEELSRFGRALETTGADLLYRAERRAEDYRLDAEAGVAGEEQAARIAHEAADLGITVAEYGEQYGFDYEIAETALRLERLRRAQTRRDAAGVADLAARDEDRE